VGIQTEKKRTLEGKKPKGARKAARGERKGRGKGEGKAGEAEGIAKDGGERFAPPSRSVLTTPPMPPGGGDAPDIEILFDRERVLGEFETRPRVEPTAGEAARPVEAAGTAPRARVAAGGAPMRVPEPATSRRRIAFVLHMHLPWVLGHGTWPHGEDWLAEAVAHCYLPLLDAFRRLADAGRRHLATVSVTPVVGAMLADPRTPAIVDRYLAQRTKAAWDSRRRHPLAVWWHGEYERLARIWESFDKDLVAALAGLADRDAVELSTSAGTHVYMPLAHTPKLVRLALRTGRELHRELFGSDPRGCWMPECAYRPGGPWRHPVTGAWDERRAGNEEFLEEQGLAWTVLDSHLLRAGDPAFPYGSDIAPEDVIEPGGPHPRPYWIRRSAVAAFLRDARSAAQVWSSHGGYPGDGSFLDFHKRHWPSGLRLWRVTASQVDMLDKLVYWPEDARERAHEQAAHFVSLVSGLDGLDGGVACAPFDMELFGHWWFEGPIWLERVLELAAPGAAVEATTPSRELGATPALRRAFFEEGSWGAGGDHRVWVNPDTEWFWRELQELERQAFAAVRWGGSRRWRRAVLNQLLLAAASDWPFLVTMGTGRDYAEMRFREHLERARDLIALGPRARVLPEWVELDLPFPEIEAEWSWPPLE
jgi:1,4-alpha-glucan branching enzyme